MKRRHDGATDVAEDTIDHTDARRRIKVSHSGLKELGRGHGKRSASDRVTGADNAVDVGNVDDVNDVRNPRALHTPKRVATPQTAITATELFTWEQMMERVDQVVAQTTAELTQQYNALYADRLLDMFVEFSTFNRVHISNCRDADVEPESVDAVENPYVF
jgi:hypothetical protein